MSEENIIEADPVFEEEFRLAKELAPTYDLYAPDNGFRKIISRSITDTYRGKRSISSFTRLATAMLKDEKEAFTHLTVFNMFTNTLKSMDTRLEILREKNSSKPEDVEELRLRTEILTKMINSLVVI